MSLIVTPLVISSRSCLAHSVSFHISRNAVYSDSNVEVAMGQDCQEIADPRIRAYAPTDVRSRESFPQSASVYPMRGLPAESGSAKSRDS